MDGNMIELLRTELAAYLEKYYMPSQETREPLLSNGKPVCRAKSSLTSGQAKNLRSLMDGLGQSFHEKLFELIDERGLTDAEVYKRANIDRKLFSKIRSNPAYHPRKATVLALAVALHLSIEEAKDLLSRAEYAFSPGSKRDLIVRFFIEHQVYDVDAINYTLDEYNLPALS